LVPTNLLMIIIVSSFRHPLILAVQLIAFSDKLSGSLIMLSRVICSPWITCLKSLLYMVRDVVQKTSCTWNLGHGDYMSTDLYKS